MSEEKSNLGRWTSAALGIQHEMGLSPDVKRDIKDVLQAELLTQGMRPALLEKLSVTFPESEKPSVRIMLANDPGGMSEQDKDRHSDIISKLTGKLSSFAKNGITTITNGVGYYGRNDTTITANTADDLVLAIGSMITNPIIKKEFLGEQMGRGPSPRQCIAGLPASCSIAC